MSVKDTIARAKLLDEGQTLSKTQKVISSNKVTGYAVNFPIYRTCKPSKVCAQNCYAAISHKPIAMKVSLNKQLALLNTTIKNPKETAHRLIKEITPKLKSGSIKFLRWNGVGDLFDESIECLSTVARALPELPIWVVTRIPSMAAKVPDLANVYVHFSLDSSSLKRYSEVLSESPLNNKLFFSYTEADGELEQPSELSEIPVSVYFTNLYGSEPPDAYKEVSCPLNTLESIDGACEECKRCWTDEALKLRSNPKKV
jgi:hypothetical protein